MSYVFVICESIENKFVRIQFVCNTSSLHSSACLLHCFSDVLPRHSVGTKIEKARHTYRCKWPVPTKVHALVLFSGLTRLDVAICQCG